MKLCNKFMRTFFILVIFATLVISKTYVILNVTAPNSTPKNLGSKLRTEWNCPHCRTKDKVKIEVLDNTNNNKVVFKTKGKNAAAGSKTFKLDPKWAVLGRTYIVRVSLKKNPAKVYGFSEPFPVVIN